MDVLPSSRFVVADIAFLVQRFALVQDDLREAFGGLAGRWRVDPVLLDNLRYVLEDL